MKLLICLLVFLSTTLAWADYVPGGNPCMGTSGTIQSVSGATSGTSLAQIIAGVASEQIFICSMDIEGVSGTTPTFSLSYGTGSNCGTGTATILPAIATAANTLYPFPPPGARIPSGNSVCYHDAGTSPIQNYFITYIQK